MRQRLLALGILLSFFVCYLQWGGGHSAFVGQVAYQILFGKSEAQNFLHPLIAIPFAGQLLVLFALFQKTPSRQLVSIGILLMGVLVLLLVLIAFLSRSPKIGLSTLPYILLAVLHFWRGRTEGVVR